MVYYCAVRGCKKEAYPGCGLTFHKVPVNKVLKTKWMEALQLEHLSKCSKVCGLHFKDDDFRTQAKRMLKPEAIPTISAKRTGKAPLTWASLQATLDPLSDVHELDLSEIETSALSEVEEDDSHDSTATKSESTAEDKAEEDEAEEEEDEKEEEWMSWPDVCRCCLATRGELDLTGSNMAEDGETEVFLEMLADCYGIKLSHVSEFGPSRLVCAECVASLRRAHRFKRQVLQAEEKFAAHLGKQDSSFEVKEEDEWADLGSDDETTVPQTPTIHQQTSSDLRTTKQPTKRKMETTEDSNDDETPPNRPSDPAPQEPMKEITYNKRSVQVISYCPKNYDDIEQIENKSNDTGCAKSVNIQAISINTDNTSVRNVDQNEMVQMVSVHSMDLSQSVKRNKLDICGSRSVQMKCHVSNINCP